MNESQVFAISSMGMATERARVEVAALNLANANTVAAPGGSLYQPLRMVARQSFDEALAQGLSGVLLTAEKTLAPPRLVHEPGHPAADARGMVSYPGVDTATEMMTLMSATRAYEANVVALNSARQLALKTLEIGGGA